MEDSYETNNKDIFQNYSIFVVPKISDIMNQTVQTYDSEDYKVNE